MKFKRVFTKIQLQLYVDLQEVESQHKYLNFFMNMDMTSWVKLESHNLEEQQQFHQLKEWRKNNKQKVNPQQAIKLDMKRVNKLIKIKLNS